MTIQTNQELITLAKNAGKTNEETINVIDNALKDIANIKDDPDYYGLKLKDALDLPGMASTMVCICIDLKVSFSENISTIENLVLFGEHDCERCGGKMEVIDGEYKMIGDGYNEPIEKGKAIWEEKQCRCGNNQIV